MGLSEEKRKELIERFEKEFGGIQREGADKLLESIRKSDFYTAPASTKYHGNFRGGLLLHSLNVYDILTEKIESGRFVKTEDVSMDAAAVIGLLHDICKTFYYVEGTRNQKTYDPEKVKAASYGVKHDSLGDFIWETVLSYEVKDQLPYGHGEKSAMMIEQYIKLEPVERYCIRWHMGFTEPKELYGTIGEAIKKYPLILATIEADLEATYILEKED